MICKNCGGTFDAVDAVRVREDYGETYLTCPLCGDPDIDEGEECRICGREMDPYKLSDGFCMDCLWAAIDYDVALKYMLSEDDGLGLANFFLDEWFRADCINKTTQELTAFFAALYGRLASAERDLAKLFPKTPAPFLEAVRNHIMPGYPNDFDCFAQCFSEWYAEERDKGDRNNGN